ncbi:MAG: hypothetical protein JW834_03095 [Candidatus Diapherotrites archaeon]|nr:hypothetical protein [Candidatus Diapherotrites archaeon]
MGQRSDLAVAIEYTDTTGQRHSVQKSVSIGFSGNTTAGFANFGMRQRSFDYAQYWWLALVVLGLAVGYAVYCRRVGKPVLPFIGRRKARSGEASR